MFKLIISLRKTVDDETEAKRVVEKIVEVANSESDLEVQARITQEIEIEE